MNPIYVLRTTFRLLFAVVWLTLLLCGCMAVAPAPEEPPAADVHAVTPGAAPATHEAQMQNPEAQATHQAMMQDPAAMATHEAEMHGAPTPAPRTAAAVALSTFTTDDFAGSGLCVMCHEGLTDAAGADVSITTHWRSTMMANAAKDPAWQAKVASEVARHPALKEVIEKKCATCHTPMAETQAEVMGTSVALFGDGFLDSAHPLHEASQEGVSYSLCHQILSDNLEAAESFSGGYEIDASTEPPDRIIYGPYENPFGRPMQMHTGYLPAFGEHTNSAALCATCHNVFTPYVDANGQIAGEFPEQTPFTEWQYSTFSHSGMTCQACHMPEAKGGVVISLMPGRLSPREPFFQHQFVGGNKFMVTLLRDHAGELGVTATASQMDATIARVDDQLARAATLSILDAGREDGTLVIRLQVSSATGHKFPTSFPSRRAWLHVVVTDGARQIVFESGRPQADGSITGNAADADPAAHEPHYDVITTADQVQIYEPIMADTGGRVTYTLLAAATYAKDNRLLATGMDKGKLPDEIAVRGAATDDANFIGGDDQITYRIAVPSAAGPHTVYAELLYQPLSYRFVQDMLADGGEHGETLSRLIAAADQMPARVSVVAPVQVP